MSSRTFPLYKMISENLKEQIARGDFTYDKPICTEKSLCEAYSVSRITAKRVLEDLENDGIIFRRRGVGSFVVQKNNEQEAYTLPKPPPDGQTAYKTMALLIPFDITKGGIFRAIEVATRRMARRGCYLTLHVYNPTEKGHQQEILDGLSRNEGVDGLIFYPTSGHLPTSLLDRFCDQGKPVVIMDKPHTHQRYSLISCENYQGNYMLTEHLVAYGHKKIAYMSRFPLEEVSSIQERYQGFSDCLLQHHPDAVPQLVLAALPDEESMSFDYPMLKHIITKLCHEGVTAIECENDEVAFYVHMCCRSLGLHTPDDISITGFDNIHWATTGSAHITTVEQDFVAIGEAIAELTLTCRQPEHRLIPVRLVPRSSSGKPPK